MVASEVEGVHLNLIDQRGARNAELLGGPSAVAAVEAQGALDVLPLDVRERQRQVAPLSAAAPPPCAAGLAEIGRQMLRAEGGGAARQKHGTLEDVAHLAHIPRPGGRQQAVQRLGGALAGAARELGLQVRQEPGHERQPVLARALAHRRQPQRHDAQAVEQVLAEAARLHVARELAVCRGDETDVHRQLAGPAQPPERLRLEHPEELRLQLPRAVAAARWPMSTGLVRKCSAPSCMARTAVAMSPCPVSRMTAAPSPRSRSSTSRPPRSGRWRSSSTTSGRSRAKVSSPRSPDVSRYTSKPSRSK